MTSLWLEVIIRGLYKYGVGATELRNSMTFVIYPFVSLSLIVILGSEEYLTHEIDQKMFLKCLDYGQNRIHGLRWLFFLISFFIIIQGAYNFLP